MSIGGLPPPPTKDSAGSFAWVAWYNQLYKMFATTGSIAWNLVDKAGSSIADLQNHSHNLLSNMQGGTTGQYYHLTAAQLASIGTSTGGGGATWFPTDGIDGEDGYPIPGPMGLPGTNGSNGATGAQGPVGPPIYLISEGEDGDIGPPGKTGATGANGTTGAQGPAGPAIFLEADYQEAEMFLVPGNQGTTGATGATGAQGPSGTFMHMFEDYSDIVDVMAGQMDRASVLSNQPAYVSYVESSGIIRSTATITGSTTTGAFTYGTLGYSDTNHLAVFQSSVNSYNQVVVQNTNAGASASADFVVGNNNSTATTFYGNFGMNSSGWAGSGAFNLANNVYLSSTSADLAIGTTTANQIRFVINNGATDAVNIGTTGLLTANVGLTIAGGTTKVAAGTTAIAPITLQSGTNLTSAAAGAVEFDGVTTYATYDTSHGRGHLASSQYFRLLSAGSITTIANFFGANSNIPLVSGGFYDIEIVAYFTMGTTASVVTWSLINSVAPTLMNIDYEMSPITGIVAPPGTATSLRGQILGSTAATQTIVTGSLTLSSNQFMRMRIQLNNATGTSLKIQLAETTTTTALVPKIGSFWRCTRLPATNVTGAYAA